MKADNLKNDMHIRELRMVSCFLRRKSKIEPGVFFRIRNNSVNLLLRLV